MPVKVQNLFPSAGTEEETATLLQGGSFRLEQIASYGQASAKNFWYDQADPEWVLLVRGTATLEFEKENFVQLGAGDYLLILAHEKHRVESTSADAVWLAIHFNNSAALKA